LHLRDAPNNNDNYQIAVLHLHTIKEKQKEEETKGVIGGINQEQKVD